MRCSKCGSEDSVKAGFNHGRQRYKCKRCDRQFTMEEDRNAQNRARALYLFITGLSMRAIARAFGVAPSTVLYWVRNFALRAYEKPTPQGPVVVEWESYAELIAAEMPVQCKANTHAIEHNNSASGTGAAGSAGRRASCRGAC